VDSDTVNNEVLLQTQVLEPSAAAPAVEVEQTEERIATKYKRKKRSHYGRDTTYDSAQLSGQLPDEQQSPEASVKQTKEEPKSVGRIGTQQKADETASTQEVFGSAETQKYVTPPEAQSKGKEERHRVLTAPWKSTPREYLRREHCTSHHRREYRDQHPRSTGSHDSSRKSRERSRSQIRHDNHHTAHGWRPSTLRQTEVEQLRSEMMKELRDMLRESSVKGAR